MRRAFQRCSSSLPRHLSTIAVRTFPVQPCLRRPETTRSTVATSLSIIRCFHQVQVRRQQSATTADQTETSTSTPGNEGPITRFEELGSKSIIHPNVIKTITRDMGFDTMTEVQTATINEAIKGTDLIAQAKTGTGKTLAFILPIVQRILNVDPHLAQRGGSRRGPRATADDIRGLIISPTRELAEQIAEEARSLTRGTSIIVQSAVGGTQKSAGLRKIQREGCHLLVATPGRLKDILSDPYSRVEAPDLAALVFDEADRLLDQGFWPEIQEIMRLLPTPQEKDRQTMLFSATVPNEVVQLVRSTLKPGFQFIKCVRDDEQPTHERIPQKVIRINGLENSLPTLIEMCQRGIQEANEPNGKPFKAIVYYNSTAEVSLAASALQGLKLPDAPQGSTRNAFGEAHPFGRIRILEIHSRLSQSERTNTSHTFRRCDSGILISSDVTARGIDFPDVTHVIQMGLPGDREQYIHRVGRTGRAGKGGEGWLVLNSMEAEAARSRLHGLPLTKDSSLTIPSLDLTKPGDVPAKAAQILAMFQQSIQRVPIYEKSKVYLAQFGVHQYVANKEALVQAINKLSQFGWGLKEPPTVSPSLAQKLRISKIPGVRIGESFDAGGSQQDSGRFNRGGFGDRQDRHSGQDFGRGGFSGRSDRYSNNRGRHDRVGREGGGRGDFRESGGRGGFREGRNSYGGPRRDDAFGRKPIYNDPFA